MHSRLYNWLFAKALYVIADPADNSVTLSKRLFKRLHIFDKDEAKVYVFRIPDEDVYAFTLNPPFHAQTQLCDIQYNAKHKCVGFETLVPTVNRIFYDYGLPHSHKCKLSIKERRTHDITYYTICKPNGKSDSNKP